MVGDAGFLWRVCDRVQVYLSNYVCGMKGMSVHSCGCSFGVLVRISLCRCGRWWFVGAEMACSMSMVGSLTFVSTSLVVL